jgi:hypothetical protein
MWLRAAAIAVAAFAFAAAPCRATASGGERVWLVVSDIHLNPYDAGTDPSLVGSDSNPALLRSVLAEMKRTVPNPAVVLIAGDFFAHEFAQIVRQQRAGSPEDAGVRTMRSIAGAFGRAFPHARFAIALGNNDAPCGDYRSELGSRYLANVASAWAPLVDRDGAAPGFARSFAQTGSYTLALPQPGLRLVVLDDVPLSNIYFGNCGADGGDAAARELAWLNDALAATPPQTRNVVMMHAPPGYDALMTQTTRGFYPWIFLRPAANAALVAALAAPQHRVAFVLAGHAHRYDYRLAGGVPVVLVGSISPIDHNNPAFYALHVSADGTIRDVGLYAYDEWTQEWQPPRSFDAKWGVDRVDAATIERLHERLETDAAMRELWNAQSNAFPSNRAIAAGAWGAGWRVAWCAQTEVEGGFARCAGVENQARLFPFLAGAAIAAAVALLAGLVSVFWLLARRLRRV